MSLIPGYPKGSDITLLNTLYVGRRRGEDGKLTKDFILITFKDNKTKEKKFHIIYKPEYTYYMLKDQYTTGHNLFFIDKDKVIPMTVKYYDLLRDIAEKTGNLDAFYQNLQNRKPGMNNKLHMNARIFMSDIDIEDYYRFLFSQEYKNEPITLNKSYMDIEVDSRDMLGDFPEPGECPINAIAFLDDRTNTVYQFLLEDDRNPLIEDYKNTMKNPEMMDKLSKFVIDAVGGYKKAYKFGVDKLQYRFFFFKEEIEMIAQYFAHLIKTDPDVILIWNMAFDLNYIIERIAKLGYDPMEIMCDDSIPEKVLRFYVDQRNYNDYEERGDYVNISQKIIWLDQMIQFASRRKGRGSYPDFKLDSIGSIIANVNKLDYSHITSNIALLPYLNFQVFSWYNIMDTVVQKCIESKTNDVDYIYTKCLINNTRFSKGHRQSIYLKNRFTKDFMSFGYIIGNNVNRWNEKPASKYPGAMVGDPTHNSSYAVMYLHGRPVLLAANVIDYDYKALYPSIILENNIATNTQIGRYEIDEQVSYNEHQDMYSSEEDVAKYSRGGEFFENMMSGNILEFCKRWLHLGDIKDVIKDMEEYFDGSDLEHTPEVPLDKNLTDPIWFTNKNTLDVVTFDNDMPYGKCIPVLFFFNNMPETAELIDEIMKGALI